jgi:diaminopimelate epimerase
MEIGFAKYHGLGNDYIVLDGAYLPNLSPGVISRICHRNFGVGSDGILVGPLEWPGADFGVRIFNPDGGEAEKSGNGLRIFTRYLLDRRTIEVGQRVPIGTVGGVVHVQVRENGEISVEMGKVSFHSSDIPVELPPGSSPLQFSLKACGREFVASASTIGNPHCTVVVDRTSAELAREIGPHVETMQIFPRRTNVEFVQVMSRNQVRVEFWERGVGYTLASGTGSSAAVSVCRKLGLVDQQVLVETSGGRLEVTVRDDWSVQLTGPVVPICSGTISPEALKGC